MRHWVFDASPLIALGKAGLLDLPQRVAIEGLIPESERDWLIGQVEEKGGMVSYKQNSDGSKSPYELNITYLDALRHPESEDLSVALACTECGATGGMRPHVVWFGEMPLEMERIYGALAECGLFLSIGTSGNVYPAAGFVQEARANGAHTVEINLEPSQGATLFAEHRYGPATLKVPEFVGALLAQA